MAFGAKYQNVSILANVSHLISILDRKCPIPSKPRKLLPVRLPLLTIFISAIPNRHRHLILFPIPVRNILTLINNRTPVKKSPKLPLRNCRYSKLPIGIEP